MLRERTEYKVDCDGETTVSELISALQEYPGDAIISGSFGAPLAVKIKVDSKAPTMAEMRPPTEDSSPTGAMGFRFQ